MNELGLTHIESLDSETVNIPGLDIDGALENTISSGKKKLRKKRITKGASSLALLSVIGLLFVGTNTFLSSEDGSNSSNSVKTAQKTPTVSTQVAEDTSATSAPTQGTNIPPANPAPVIDPKLVTIKNFGNASLCDLPSPNLNPGPGEAVVGPATTARTWNPSIGQTRVENALPSSRQLVIKNVAHNNGVKGAYVDLISGFDASNSYANITTLGFKYCESGYKLEITPNTNSSGYSISTTSL